jgi:hypothetical protein
MEDDRAQVDLGIAADLEEAQAPEPVARQPKKRFVGRRTAAEAAASKNERGSGTIEDAGAIQGNDKITHLIMYMYNISYRTYILTTSYSRPTKESTPAPEPGPT